MHELAVLFILSGLAELIFCLWRLLVGVNLKKWREQEQIALPGNNNYSFTR